MVTIFGVTFSITSILVGAIFFTIFIVLMRVGQKLFIKWQSWKILKKVHEEFQVAFLDKLTVIFGEENVGELKTLLEFRIIEPIAKDPQGIMQIIAKNIRNMKGEWKRYIKKVFPDLSYKDVCRYECIVSAGAALLFTYKYLRHWIKFGQRYKIWMIGMQVVMMKELYYEMMEMYNGALDAFEKNLPIGDGIGPLVVTKLAEEYGCTEWTFDEYDEVLWCEKDNLIFVRASEGSVGYEGSFIYGFTLSKLITIDAGLKWLGEQTGSWYKGIGVACGGEVSRYGMEQRCRHIPTIMHVCRMWIDECLTVMNTEILESVYEGIERVKEDLNDHEKIMIIGIGNATGVPAVIRGNKDDASKSG